MSASELNSATENRERLITVQWLRGLAAVSVVLYHSCIQADRAGWIFNSAKQYASGVDVFFVISGFIMLYITTGSKIAVGQFYYHRLVRIVPMYWLLTAFVVAVMLVAPSTLQTSKFQLTHVIASFLFIPHLHPVHVNKFEPVLFPGWTLNYEMMFYLIFGLSLFLVHRLQRLIVVLAMIGGLVGMHSLVTSPTTVLSFYSSSIVLEFGYGVVLGYLFTAVPRRSLSIAACAIMIAAGVFGLVIGGLIIPGPRGVVLGLPALLLVGGFVFLERSWPTMPELPALRFVGDSSYSLYLSHTIVLSACGQIFRRLGLLHSWPGLAAFFVFAISASLVVGSLLYWYVERWILGVLRGRKRNRRGKYVAVT